MQILLTGIPAEKLVQKIISRHGKPLSLYVAEMRPFEEQIAEAIKELEFQDLSVTLITDNMTGALFQNREIEAVYGCYTEKEKGYYSCLPGTHIAAVVSSEFCKPFYLFKTEMNETIEKGIFFGESISIENVHILDFQADLVPEILITEVLE